MTAELGRVVIGGGIIGLATARALQLGGVGDVTVVDKAAGPGAHQTGHNSGVIHSGLYYRPGSEKARLCVQGAVEMIRFCADHGLPHRTSGKVVVAVDDGELARLDELTRRGAANGLEGLRRLDANGIREIEPHARGIAGLHVPTTGVTDYVAVCRALIDEITSRGGTVQWGVEATNVARRGELAEIRAADGSVLRAAGVVVCAGVQSDRLARERHDMRVVPFRGAYFDLVPEAAALVRSMIYPVPDPRFPFLGVHFTRHVDDTVSCGPNAILAMSRERHRRYAFDPRDVADAMAFPGTWRLIAKYWRPGSREVALDLSRRLYVKQLQRYVPEVTMDHLTVGPVGIRAQAITRSGALVEDFSIIRDGPVTYVRNAPSPAATASLAIARHIAELSARA